MTALADPDFRLLFEGGPGLYLVLRPDDRFTVVAVSNAYLQATLIDRATAIGRGLFEIFPDNPEDGTATGTRNLRASLERVVATGIPDGMAVQRYDIRLPAHEGGGFIERFWSPMNSPVFAPDGSLAYIIHRAEDVTEYVRLTKVGEVQAERSADLERRNQAMQQDILRRSEELDAANNRLREANTRLAGLDQAKTVFFNNISHEFRTPLTLMLGPAEEALADAGQALPPIQRERMAIIHRNGLRLMHLVNALLDFARLEAGRMQARYVATDLAAATTELASMFDSATAQAGLSLVIDCPPLPAPVWVDREMWERIVLNLVSNAFKFTTAGGITVRLRASGSMAEFSVIDTGSGIPADELPHLFERFHRVQGAQGRSIEGSGIGLSMVAELVRMHGGTVAVESRPGAGSTFSVRIPFGKGHLPGDLVADAPGAAAATGHLRAAVAAELDSQVAAGAVPPEAESPDAAGRILLVEDNPDLRGFTAAILARHYRVQAVGDGEEALAAIARQMPDLVLSDVMMPRLDGLGLLRRLRADPATRTLPVILLSARAGEEATVAGLDASAEDYLSKPYSARELLARVRTHLAMARIRREWADSMRQANHELEAFSYSVSHDLRAPLRAIDGFAKALADGQGDRLDADGRHFLERIRAGSLRMGQLIEDLLTLSRLSRVPLRREPVALDAIARRVVADLAERDPARRVEVVVAPDVQAVGDPRLLAVVLENLLGNAWKFTARREGVAHIAFEHERSTAGDVYRVRDDGAGFDMAHAGRLFAPFQRLHRDSDFPGSGIGLATVQRIIARHGGRIWAGSSPGAGAAFSFTLGGGA